MNDVLSSCHYGATAFFSCTPFVASRDEGAGSRLNRCPGQERTDDHLHAVSGFLGRKTVVAVGCQSIQNLLGEGLFVLGLLRRLGLTPSFWRTSRPLVSTNSPGRRVINTSRLHTKLIGKDYSRLL